VHAILAAVQLGLSFGNSLTYGQIGIEIEEEESLQYADIFNKLKLRRDHVPIRPLMERKLK